jgi:DNA-binding beta-propeller fold protein YncE
MSPIRLEIVNITNPAAMTKVGEINVGGLPGYGGMNSVAVANGIIAVAVENIDGSTDGVVALYSTTTNALLRTISVGVLPDQLVFSADGRRLIVANEGERDLRGTPSTADDRDPAGSVSIIDLTSGVAAATCRRPVSRR